MTKDIMDDFPLTPQQVKVFKMIKAFYRRKKFMPSYVEIMTKLNIKSRSQIKRCLDGLSDKGFIEQIPSQSRQIRILKNL